MQALRLRLLSRRRLVSLGIALPFILYTMLLLAEKNAGDTQHSMTGDGFVTYVLSSRYFMIGRLGIHLGISTKCEEWREGGHGRIVDALVCQNLHLVPGSSVHLTYSIDGKKQIWAQVVSLKTRREGIPYVIHSSSGSFLKEPTSASIPSLSMQGFGLIENDIIRNEHHNTGDPIAWVNGYPFSMLATRVSSLATCPQITYTLRPHGIRGVSIATHPLPEPDTSSRMGRTTALVSNTWLIYRRLNGHDKPFDLTAAIACPNQVNSEERSYLRRFSYVVSKPQPTQHGMGTVRFQNGIEATIVPNSTVQEGVSRIGQLLIPEAQKDLADSDPTKISFRFAVVKPLYNPVKDYLLGIDQALPKVGRVDYTFYSPRPNTIVNEIVAMPNGMVLIPDSVLVKLSNVAQLSALMSYAIASVVQKQGYIAWPLFTSTKARKQFIFNNHVAYGVFAFGAWQKMQVISLGIRQMYLAGYDIREAPFAWAVAQSKPVNNPVIDSKNPDKEIPWYAAYAFNYISQYYKDVDYSKLKRGRAEYQQFLQELRQADPEAFASQKAKSNQAAKNQTSKPSKQ